MAQHKWRRTPVGHNLEELLGSTAKTFQAEVPDGHLSVFVTRDDGMYHLSISHRTNDDPPKPGRYPTWDEIKEARYLFCPDEISMAMLLPPKGRVRERP